MVTVVMVDVRYGGGGRWSGWCRMVVCIEGELISRSDLAALMESCAFPETDAGTSLAAAEPRHALLRGHHCWPIHQAPTHQYLDILYLPRSAQCVEPCQQSILTADTLGYRAGRLSPTTSSTCPPPSVKASASRNGSTMKKPISTIKMHPKTNLFSLKKTSSQINHDHSASEAPNPSYADSPPSATAAAKRRQRDEDGPVYSRYSFSAW